MANSAFSTLGVDHGQLPGLTDDDHTQYALLAGRSGGQTLIGGTAAGDDLVLKSTSNADKGTILVGEVGIARPSSFDLDYYMMHWGRDGYSLPLISACHASESPALVMYRGRGTHASPAIVQSGDVLGQVVFYGDDGTSTATIGALIAAYCEGTPGADDMPGCLAFATTPDGGAGPVEAVRINTKRQLLVGTSQSVALSGTTAPGLVVAGDVGSAYVNIAGFAASPALILGSSAHATIGSHTAVSNGSALGYIIANGSDGSGWVQTSYIRFEVDQAVSAGNVKSKVVVTTPAGDSLTVRSTGEVGVNNTNPAASSATMQVDGFSSRHGLYGTAVTAGYAGVLGYNANGFGGYFATGAAGPAGYFNNTNNAGYEIQTVSTSNSSTGYSQVLQKYMTGASGSFVLCQSNIDGTPDSEFNLTTDGVGYCDGAWNGGGADYAEWFEWSDGNPQNQDRRGMTVVLDGEKVRLALPTDLPSDIVGVVSSRPAFTSDSAELKWHDKFLRDALGAYVMEDYKVFDWPDMPKDREGRDRPNFTEEQARKHGITIPADARFVVQKRRKLNPEFDPTAVYIPRSERPEWDPIGMVGKVWVRKDQPVGDRWKLLRAGDTTNLYLVR